MNLFSIHTQVMNVLIICMSYNFLWFDIFPHIALETLDTLYFQIYL